MNPFLIMLCTVVTWVVTLSSRVTILELRVIIPLLILFPSYEFNNIDIATYGRTMAGVYVIAMQR